MFRQSSYPALWSHPPLSCCSNVRVRHNTPVAGKFHWLLRWMGPPCHIVLVNRPSVFTVIANSSWLHADKGRTKTGQTLLLPSPLLTSSTCCKIGSHLLCWHAYSIQSSSVPWSKSHSDCALSTSNHHHTLILYSSLNYLHSTCFQLSTIYMLRAAFCLLSLSLSLYVFIFSYLIQPASPWSCLSPPSVPWLLSLWQLALS